jgi:CRP-like cAMP-binding protein
MISIMFGPIIETLSRMATRRRAFGAGEALFHRGDSVASLFVVAEGRVALVRTGPDGGLVLLQRAGPGEVLAEASPFSAAYHCDGVAEEAGAVLCIPKVAFRARLRDDPAFAEGWAGHLGREIQNARFRGELLSRRTVADRLDAWLAWHDALPPKGEWLRLAAELAVSPEALYRELARRRITAS